MSRWRRLAPITSWQWEAEGWTWEGEGRERSGEGVERGRVAGNRARDEVFSGGWFW